MGLSIFPLAEGICALLDVGRPSLHDDPFVGFNEVHPLFELNADGTKYERSPARKQFFAYESFPATKAPSTYRIFCVGGSTVQGRPHSIPTSFTTWLKLALNEADSSKHWEVVNCGGISYASYRLIPIIEECLRYQPDLFIVCTGVNEFLEDRSYGHLKEKTAVAESQQQLGRFRTFVLLRELMQRVQGRTTEAVPDDRPVLQPDTDPILDYYDSLKLYHWDDEWRAGVVAHFESNLRRMVGIVREAGLPLLFVGECANLADCPPFKSEHPRLLTREEEMSWTGLVAQAQEKFATDVPGAISLLEQSLRIDDRYARVLYDLGKCYQSLGRYPEARKYLVRARDCDVCPLRMITPLEEAQRRVVHELQAPFLDSHALLEAREPTGIMGDYMLIDRVHPSFTGHQLIADELVEMLARQSIAAPQADWKAKAHAAYDKHFGSLPYTYFAHGQQEAKAVEGWTQGIANPSRGITAEQRFPHRPVSPDDAPLPLPGPHEGGTTPASQM